MSRLALVDWLPLPAVLVALAALAFLLASASSGKGRAPGRPAPGEYVRPYGPRAPWNVPVAELPRHPESDHYADLLWRTGCGARPGNFNLNFTWYTYPVYYVQDATGEYPTAIRNEWNNLYGKTIPWNPEWQPAPGADAQVIILDPETGREWNLWQVEFRDGVVHATNGNLVDGDYRTKEDGFPPSRGIGIQYLAMLVRPEEVAQGEIPHALSMPVSNTCGITHLPPATKQEHSHGRPGIPEGMRFALDISEQDIEDWIASLPEGVPGPMREYARIVAHALRDYGWFITDTSGAAHLQHEAWVSAGPRWAELGLEPLEIGGKEYPRDLLDGLMAPERIYALVPSDQYPEHLRP